MARAGILLRIHGAQNARGNIIRFRTTTKERIVNVLDENIADSVQNMRDVLHARFTEGSGRAADSLIGDVTATPNGAQVKISIVNYREVKYMTTLVEDSDFRPTPYPIVAKRQFMQFYWKRLGRRVSFRRVTHPGFGPTDVLRSVAENELSRLGYLVEYEVRSAVAEVQSGGRTLRVSGRR